MSLNVLGAEVLMPEHDVRCQNTRIRQDGLRTASHFTQNPHPSVVSGSTLAATVLTLKKPTHLGMMEACLSTFTKVLLVHTRQL